MERAGVGGAAEVATLRNFLLEIGDIWSNTPSYVEIMSSFYIGILRTYYDHELR